MTSLMRSNTKVHSPLRWPLLIQQPDAFLKGLDQFLAVGGAQEHLEVSVLLDGKAQTDPYGSGSHNGEGLGPGFRILELEPGRLLAVHRSLRRVVQRVTERSRRTCRDGP